LWSRPADTSANLRQIKTPSFMWCFFHDPTPPIRSQGPSGAMTQQNELSRTGSGTGLIVVVIGGDLALRHALKFWLELEGLTVRSYVSGAEFLAAGELNRCDCLVVDEKSPETSGLQLIAQLRHRSFSAPAILVTGQPSPGLCKEAEKAGVPIVEKPLFGNGLLDTIRDATCGRLG
jgi:two-component system, LuxR family, response regulator FixJ